MNSTCRCRVHRLYAGLGNQPERDLSLDSGSIVWLQVDLVSG